MIQGRIQYEITQDTAKNTSTIKPTSAQVYCDDALGSFYVTGYARVNGQNAWASTSWDAAVTLQPSWTTISKVFSAGKTVTIQHDENGNASATFAVQFSFDSNYYGGEEYHGSVTIQLPNIPRKTGVSAGAVDLGKAMTITLTPAVATFQSSISYKCGSASGTVSGWSTNTKVTWTPPLTLANQVTNAAKVPIVLTVTTRNASGTTVCTVTYTVNCTIPASMAPTVTMALSDKKGYTAKYAGYIQSKSQLQAAVTATGAYGATIASITVKCGSITGTGATTVFSLPTSGTVAVTVSVKDSRGKVTTKTQNITVLAYKTPTISISQLARCDDQGNLQPTAAYAKAQITASVPAMGNLNGTQYALKWRKVGESAWSSKAVPNSEGLYSLSNAPCLFAAGIDDRYECKAAVTDDFGTTESRVLILSVAHALLDMDRSTKAVGIGQRANTAGMLSIGMDMRLFDHRITELGTPVEAGDAVPKGYADQGMHSRNLLDNGWFTVNQRAQTSYPTASQVYYHVDRWKAKRFTTVDVNTTGIVFTNTASTSRGIIQIVDNPSVFSGATLTLSAKLNAVPPRDSEMILVANNTVVLRIALDTLLNTKTVELPASITSLSVEISAANAGESIDIRAVKLEYGSVSTLANDHAPDYAAELLRCQRYYFRTLVMGNGHLTTSGTERQLILRTPTKMRDIPVVIIPSNMLMTVRTPAGYDPQFPLAGGTPQKTRLLYSSYTMTDGAAYTIGFEHEAVPNLNNVPISFSPVNANSQIALSADL